MGVREADDEVARTRTSTGDHDAAAEPDARATHALREFLEWNWLPQNRDYLYDYFRDNCSTRVRDALDRVLGGALRTSSRAADRDDVPFAQPAAHGASVPLTYTGLLLGLGCRPTGRSTPGRKRSSRWS
jgi:hypothetical protein